MNPMIEVVCGDSAKVLKGIGREFDVLITDPPYAIPRSRGRSRVHVWNDHVERTAFLCDDCPTVGEDVMKIVLNSFRCLSPCGSYVVFTSMPDSQGIRH